MNRQHLNKTLLLLRQQIPPSSQKYPQQILANGAFSTSSLPKKKKINLEETLSPSSNTNKPPNQQPFVTHRLRPGQPNPLSQIFKKRAIKSDPIHRPPWRHNAKANIISAEDFANRPRVIFEEEFDSMHDGMIILSWLNEKQRQDIYSAYTKMMIEQESEFQTTSHEYVMRVIGEKFNVSADRVGAIVQGCHDEEQMAKEDPEMVHDKLAQYVDAKIQEHIDNAYKAYGEVNPNEFIEDPIESAGIRLDGSSGEYVAVEDLYDVDDLTKQAILREKDEAQLEIDGHVYKEDIDDDEIQSNVNKDCMDLIKAQNDAFKKMTNSWKRNEDDVENPLPLGGKVEIEDDDGNTTVKEAERRPRWKYVAQTINVREQKQNKTRKKKSKKEKPTNTIVECDGELRVATMKELEGVAWKSVRDDKEFPIQGVKNAWLERKKGEKGGWGRVPEEVKEAAKARLAEESKEVDESEDDTEDEAESKTEDEDKK